MCQVVRLSYFRNAAPRDKRDLVEYNFAKSDTLTVPGAWNSQKKELFYYEGTVWYERSFTYRRPPGKRVFLGVGAANYLARVYVNGTEVCAHEGGFTGFNCDHRDVRDGAGGAARAYSRSPAVHHDGAGEVVGRIAMVVILSSPTDRGGVMTEATTATYDCRTVLRWIILRTRLIAVSLTPFLLS